MKTEGKRFKKRLFILLIITVFALTGCAGVDRITTTITDPNKGQWIIVSKHDSKVVITQKYGRKTITVEVDNQGKIHWTEGLMQYVLTKPEVNLSNKEGR